MLHFYCSYLSLLLGTMILMISWWNWYVTQCCKRSQQITRIWFYMFWSWNGEIWPHKQGRRNYVRWMSNIYIFDKGIELFLRFIPSHCCFNLFYWVAVFYGYTYHLSVKVPTGTVPKWGKTNCIEFMSHDGYLYLPISGNVYLLLHHNLIIHSIFFYINFDDT